MAQTVTRQREMTVNWVNSEHVGEVFSAITRIRIFFFLNQKLTFWVCDAHHINRVITFSLTREDMAISVLHSA